MGTALRFGLVLCLSGVRLIYADIPSGDAAPTGDAPLPQQNFLSSLKQGFQQDFEHQVVRGHFDVGSPPDVVHRYYCLVNARTGKRQVNGVAGEPFLRPDGMTGIKGTAVSLYTCASSENQGLLVTTGYVLTGGAAAGAAAPVPARAAAASAPAASPLAAPSGAPYHVDVAGVALGMSLDQVRAVLKSKKLLDYHESTQDLGHFEPANRGVPRPATQFVNQVAAWTPSMDGEGEAYEVMFTPVPGKERAMAIIHSVGYSTAHAVRETALNDGLIKKYGGFNAAEKPLLAPTWRVRSDGVVRVGDSCQRRGLFGGLAEVGTGGSSRPNVALKTTPDEFRYQIETCGVAIVTEDHAIANDSLSHDEPVVVRFTVSAYAPSLAFEGATAAAQLMQASAATGVAGKVDAARAQEPVVPNL